MASSTGLFSKVPVINLNPAQQEVYTEFAERGMTEDFFKDHYWFKQAKHAKIFSYLINKRNYSFAEALYELIELEDIHLAFYLKHKLIGEPIAAFNQNVFKLFIALRPYGLKPRHLLEDSGLDFHDQDFIANYHLPLVYLVRAKNFSCEHALLLLKQMSNEHLRFVIYGLEVFDVSALAPLRGKQIDTLVKHQQTIGFDKPDLIAKMTDEQIDCVKQWYHFGLTPELALAHFPDDEACERRLRAFKQLIICGYTVPQTLACLHDLDVAESLAEGLTLEETSGLSRIQMVALAQCKNFLNEMKGSDLLGKDWFYHQTHVEALDYLVNDCFVPVKEALSEIEALSFAQLEYMVRLRKRYADVAGLNGYHLEAIRTLPYIGVIASGADFHDQAWFNSEEHVKALLGYFHHYKGQAISDGLAILRGLNKKQLKIISAYRVTLEDLLALSPLHEALLVKHMKESDFQLNINKIIQAKWLISSRQINLFESLCDLLSIKNALKVVEQATQDNQLQVIADLLDEILFSHMLKMLDENNAPFLTNHKILDLAYERLDSFSEAWRLMSAAAIENKDRVIRHFLLGDVFSTQISIEDQISVLRQTFTLTNSIELSEKVLFRAVTSQEVELVLDQFAQSRLDIETLKAYAYTQYELPKDKEKSNFCRMM